MHYIIGIGNPEDEYGNTRHNAGKILVRALAEKCGVDSWKHVSFDKMTIASSVIKNIPVTFALSGVYMNESGIPVRALYEKEHGVILIVHDDLDLAIGTYKLSRNKGDGGHNGITSINQLVPDEDILRLRIGISPTDTDGIIRRVSSEEQVEYVLKPFSQNEKDKIEGLAPTILQLLEVMVTEGVDKAMTLYNR